MRFVTSIVLPLATAQLPFQNKNKSEIHRFTFVFLIHKKEIGEMLTKFRY